MAIDPRLLDRNWRLQHLYSVTGKDGGQTLPFKPNLAQQHLFSCLQTKQKVIVLKARQLGITTGASMYFLDEVLFRRNIQALSVFQDRDHAISAFDGKVHFAWQNIHPDIKGLLAWKVDTERANQLSFGFGDGSSSSYTVGTSGRSGTFQLVHISELAALGQERPQDAKEVITGTIPAVPTNGLILIESTASGETGYFADYWNAAQTKRNGYHPIFFNWRWDKEEIAKAPLTDIPKEFLDLQKMHNLTEKELFYYVGKWQALGCDWTLLRQEYPTTPEEAFTASLEKFFDVEAIDEYLELAEEGKREGSLTIFTEPKPGRTYVIGADPSEGVGRDHSAAVVVELDGIKPKVVAIYADDRCPPDDFAYLLMELAEKYNHAAVVVERNNHGHAVLAVLKRIYDEEVLYRPTDPLTLTQKESARLGFQTNAATKPLILHALSEALRDRSLLIPSQELLQELRQYPRSEATKYYVDPSATRHFDLLMAFAIALHGTSFALRHAKSGRIEVVQSNVSHINSDEFAAI